MKKIAWVVDDVEVVRTALSMMLKILGYEVEAFGDARAPAKALMENNRPDILFVDINIPKTSGIELLKYIRRQSAWKTLPIVMVTSESDEIMVEEAIRLGADGYVFKPVNFEELTNAISMAMKRRALLSEKE
ncbi:MAG: response regulator [Anaerolineaceae bacterium]|nr:response regulator [Anaerolineaceae bacterium]